MTLDDLNLFISKANDVKFEKYPLLIHPVYAETALECGYQPYCLLPKSALNCICID